MVCTKCGNKNKDNAVYCDKCMEVLSYGTDAGPASGQGVSQQGIFLIITGAMMVLSVVVLPLFNAFLADVAVVEFKLFGTSEFKALGFTKEIEIEPNTFQSLLSVLMLVFPVILIVCSVMKNFRIQNLFSVLNLALSAVLLVSMTIERSYISYEYVNIMPNMGLYSYIILSIIALYSTHSINEKVSGTVWAGSAVFALGIIFWFIGYSTRSSQLTNGFAFSANEIIGIAAAIIGGIIAVIGYEIEFYTENPKKIYTHAQTE